MSCPEDIVVYEANVDLIRMRPEIFGGPVPRRARLAQLLISSLRHFGIGSISAEAYGEWWLIITQNDWLTIDGQYRVDRWHRISAAPEIGLEAMHPEVLLTAFSEVLFTATRESLDFIVGDNISNQDVAARAEALLGSAFQGRAVGFYIRD